MASSSRRRWPTGVTPISLRSSAVRLGSTSASIALSREWKPKWRAGSAVDLRQPARAHFKLEWFAPTGDRSDASLCSDLKSEGLISRDAPTPK